jgi:hypothetical protein
MSVVTVGILLWIALDVWQRYKKEKDEKENNAGAENPTEDSDADSDIGVRLRIRTWRIGAIISGICVPVVWLLLDDLRTQPAIINENTICVGYIFAANVVLTVIYGIVRRNAEREEEEKVKEKERATEPIGVCQKNISMRPGEL